MCFLFGLCILLPFVTEHCAASHTLIWINIPYRDASDFSSGVQMKVSWKRCYGGRKTFERTPNREHAQVIIIFLWLLWIVHVQVHYVLHLLHRHMKHCWTVFHNVNLSTVSWFQRPSKSSKHNHWLIAAEWMASGRLLSYRTILIKNGNNTKMKAIQRTGGLLTEPCGTPFWLGMSLPGNGW